MTKECRELLKASKAPLIPRSCQICGLGPCRAITPYSNNPPDVEITLTMDDAQFMLANAEAAIHQGLMLLDPMGGFNLTPEKAAKVVDMNERFKRFRDQLKKQGVNNG